MSTSKIKKLINDIRFVGLRPALLTLVRTQHRDYLDSRYPLEEGDYPLLEPGPLREITPTERGAKARFQDANLDVSFIAEDILRVSWEPGLPPPPYSLSQREWEVVPFKASKAGEDYLLETRQMRVIISPDGGIVFTTAEGVVFREDLPPTRQGSKWSHHALLEPESHLYGLGERAAPLNLRGGMYLHWNVDPGGSYGPGKDPLYFCAPVYIERNNRHSHIVFYENTNPGIFTLTETAAATFYGGMLRYYIIPGPIHRALPRFSELIGKPGMPPRWALGYHQSRWGYRSEEDIRKVAEGFRQHDLPISAIHLDIDYMDGFRVFTVNKERFPNITKLAADLQEQNIQLVAIIDPGVKVDRQFSVYQEGRRQNYFVKEPNGKDYMGLVWPGLSSFPDFSNPAVRDWWADKYISLIQQGIRGFWHDMNEPTSFVAWGDNRLPLAVEHFLEGQGGNHKQAHNVYGHLMAEAGFSGQIKHNPGKRPWMITRAGWVGTQRYSWLWTGDIETSWKSYQMCIPMILNLSLSGQPFAGPDIGGFSGSPSAELYTRWFELATFLPFFRTHSAVTTDEREPWVYGEETTKIIRKFLKLRYALMPHLYSLAWAASNKGLPIIRPMFWPDRTEIQYWAINDQFLLGDQLLVAPILEEGESQREVTLPPGRWYDFWSGESLQSSSQPITVKASIDSIPIFCKEGALLPLEQTQGELVIQYYATDKAASRMLAYELYSDLGDGPISRETNYRIDLLYVTQSEEKVTIEREGTGAFMLPYGKMTIQVIGWSIASCKVDGQLLTGLELDIPMNFQKIELYRKV